MEIESEDILFYDFNKTKVIVTFGGIRNGIGMPMFEFRNMLSIYNDFDQIFIRDTNQAWYHKGVNDFAHNLTDIKIKLAEYLSKYENVVFIGNSMGGFAAILFGALLNVDKVITFSPQTFIDKYRRYYYDDKRWKIQIDDIQELEIKHHYYNLKKVLKTNNYETSFEIIYSSFDRLDRIHCERLSKCKNLNLKSFAFGGHSLVSELKNRGILRDILNEHLL